MERRTAYIRILSLTIAAVTFAAACSNSPTIKVDLKKAQKSRIEMTSLCVSVDAVQLSFPDSLRPESPKACRLAVAEDGFYVLNEQKNRIDCFSTSGSYRSSIIPESGITDFFVTDKEAIDVLSENAILIYNPGTLGLEKRIPLTDSLLILGSIGRRKDDPFSHTDVIELHGMKDGTDCICEYFLNDNKLFITPNPEPIDAQNLASAVADSRFFSSGDGLYFMYAHSGDIWRSSAFFSPEYCWDFRDDDTGAISFRNAQMSDNRLYMSLEADGSCWLLIADRATGRHFTVTTMRDGTSFPLGVIKNNTNYYLCTAKEAGSHYSQGMIDPDLLKEETNPVILKYKLK